jgi:hypothetical protein
LMVRAQECRRATLGSWHRSANKPSGNFRHVSDSARLSARRRRGCGKMVGELAGLRVGRLERRRPR